MSNVILFVFEGEVIEKQIFNSIEKWFFSSSENRTIIKSSFRGEIFQLWNMVKDDEDLDIVEVLKERPDCDIKGLNRKDVAEVHLFFDHDAHSRPDLPEQYHEKIVNLLNTFDNEYERGKLWISYPMAESLKHCKKYSNICFKDAQIKIYDYGSYKELVNKNSDFQNIGKFDISTWCLLTTINIQRTFCLVNNEYEAVSDYEKIKEWFDKNAVIIKTIHEKQFEKFINKKTEVVALSPFPLFLLYYFGKPFFERCNCSQIIKTCSFFCYS